MDEVADYDDAGRDEVLLMFEFVLTVSPDVGVFCSFLIQHTVTASGTPRIRLQGAADTPLGP